MYPIPSRTASKSIKDPLFNGCDIEFFGIRHRALAAPAPLSYGGANLGREHLRHHVDASRRPNDVLHRSDRGSGSSPGRHLEQRAFQQDARGSSAAEILDRLRHLQRGFYTADLGLKSAWLSCSPTAQPLPPRPWSESSGCGCEPQLAGSDLPKYCLMLFSQSWWQPIE
jgi:hypothetical protein